MLQESKTYIGHHQLRQSRTCVEILNGLAAENSVGADSQDLRCTVILDRRGCFAKRARGIAHLSFSAVLALDDPLTSSTKIAILPLTSPTSTILDTTLAS